MRDQYSTVIRTADGGRIKVTARFTEKGDTGIDTEHMILDQPYTEVSFMGEVFDKGHREAWAFGQVTADYLPAHHPIRLLWGRWHLNGMRSHCAHQDRAVKWDETPPCESTGYRCGSAWLVEPLPLDVVRQIIAVMTTRVEPVQ